jgi:hypothetical protein
VTDEELRTKQQKKKEAQAKAWQKWYRSPKGAEYRKRAKEKRVKET